MKLEIREQMFEKFPNKISLNSIQWEPSYFMRADERDRQT